MYTERIFSPYGSESTRASTGIWRVSLSFRRNNLLNTTNTGTLHFSDACLFPSNYSAHPRSAGRTISLHVHLEATSGWPLAVRMMQG